MHTNSPYPKFLRCLSVKPKRICGEVAPRVRSLHAATEHVAMNHYVVETRFLELIDKYLREDLGHISAPFMLTFSSVNSVHSAATHAELCAWRALYKAEYFVVVENYLSPFAEHHASMWSTKSVTKHRMS